MDEVIDIFIGLARLHPTQQADDHRGEVLAEVLSIALFRSRFNNSCDASTHGGMFWTTASRSSNPHPSLIFDGMRRCWTTARMAVNCPVSTSCAESLVRNAFNNLTRPGILPFCCQPAGVSKKGRIDRYSLGTEDVCSSSICPRIWNT